MINYQRVITSIYSLGILMCGYRVIRVYVPSHMSRTNIAALKIGCITREGGSGERPTP